MVVAGSGGRLAEVGDGGGEEERRRGGNKSRGPGSKVPQPELLQDDPPPPTKSAQASSCWLLPPAFSPRVFSAFQFPESRPSAEHGAGRNGRKTGVLCL